MLVVYTVSIEHRAVVRVDRDVPLEDRPGVVGLQLIRIDTNVVQRVGGIIASASRDLPSTALFNSGWLRTYRQISSRLP
jgi:hypothetical protein